MFHSVSFHLALSHNEHWPRLLVCCILFCNKWNEWNWPSVRTAIGLFYSVSVHFRVFSIYFICFICFCNNKKYAPPRPPPPHTHTHTHTNTTPILTTNTPISLPPVHASPSSDFQGPVFQSIVSLTSLLRVISLTVLANSMYNILIFFAEKCKSYSIFSAKNFSTIAYHSM